MVIIALGFLVVGFLWLRLGRGGLGGCVYRKMILFFISSGVLVWAMVFSLFMHSPIF
jgi:hypothetical protein